MKIVKSIPWEGLVWLGALVSLAIYNPSVDHHITLCPLQFTGLEFCPGCGLGRSISFFFRGEIRQSLSLHPLGIFAVIILSFRIMQLTKLYLTQHGKNN